jgi:uncharacterized protein YndB with AHSA1/START domain
MGSVSASVTINQPVDKVFAYITSVENHKTWQPGILDAKLTPSGPVSAGSIYHYTTEVMGRRYESQMQVSAFESNKKWGVKTVGVPKPVETVYLFEGQGQTTQLTISMELAGGYPAAAEGMIKLQTQKNLDEQARRIKQLMEK